MAKKKQKLKIPQWKKGKVVKPATQIMQEAAYIHVNNGAGWYMPNPPTKNKVQEDFKFVELSPGRMRQYARCNMRMMDIYESVIKQKTDNEIARLTRLVGKLRGSHVL